MNPLHAWHSGARSIYYRPLHLGVRGKIPLVTGPEMTRHWQFVEQGPCAGNSAKLGVP